MNRIEKAWGYEEIIHNGEYCCKKLVYTKEIASSLHYHEHKHETFVVGTGYFEVEAYVGIATYSMVYGPGDFVVLPPGTRHRVICIEPGFLVEASTHDDPADCVRIIPSES
jgi:mannose-6-phosphate isomerase-like protein (cupin superfamily)